EQPFSRGNIRGVFGTSKQMRPGGFAYSKYQTWRNGGAAANYCSRGRRSGLRKSLARLLSASGYRVESFASAEEFTKLEVCSWMRCLQFGRGCRFLSPFLVCLI